jgi:Fe-S cluster biogenesis protein NfuA
MTDAGPAMHALDRSQTVLGALDGVRRRIRAHAGDVEVVSVSDEGEVTLAFTGACRKCPSQAMTVGASILPVVESLPGVKSVSMQGLAVSEAAMRRVRAMFG